MLLFSDRLSFPKKRVQLQPHFFVLDLNLDQSMLHPFSELELLLLSVLHYPLFGAVLLYLEIINQVDVRCTE